MIMQEMDLGVRPVQQIIWESALCYPHRGNVNNPICHKWVVYVSERETLRSHSPSACAADRVLSVCKTLGLSTEPPIDAGIHGYL